jgi:hypothetical protein
MIVWGLTSLSCANALYTVTKTRKYRLFETSLGAKPSTPSARRVKVQSEMGTSSPLRYLAELIAPETAESRAHPDKAKDVWELSVWDPLPISLQISCIFSPGHILVYLMFLPLAPLDPRPSVTVFNTLCVQVLLSAQLLLLSSRHSQQAKDQAIIQKEVMHEYDTKFVQPRIHPVMREVGTQTAFHGANYAKDIVQTGTPTTLIRNSYFTRQNSRAPSEDVATVPSNVMSPRMFTPPRAISRHSEAITPVQQQSVSSARKSLPAGYVSAGTPAGGIPASTTTGGLSFGGNMGVHSHNKSPLKKASSQGHLQANEPLSPRNSREMASYEQRLQGRPASPFQKRANEASGTSRPNPFASGRPRSQYERYPKLR